MLYEGDESQAFYYHELAYRHYPVDMNVISWLGAYYVKMDVFEKAIGFFERAGQIEPFEVKWQLMIASCHRRAKNTQKAYDRYRSPRNPHRTVTRSVLTPTPTPNAGTKTSKGCSLIRWNA